MTGFILGAFLWVPVGFVLCAVMSAGKRADQEVGHE